MDCKRLISILVLSVVVPAAMANPEGAQVVQGNASFTRPDANTLNITNSRNAIINWQQFNIDRGQTTRFIQPDRNSAVLNRVLSNNPSKIHGKLRSNGQVFLINQHGLMVGAGASIDTAGFYGSTLNLTDADFLSGKLNFSGGGLGGIDNQGYIHAGPDGNVVLIAPDITNGGVIEVDGGNVILAAGESIRISSLNDGLIEFDVQAPDNTILNLGTIIAKQGAARLFAGNLQHSGAINATGLVRNADGTISLVAGGKVEVSGSVIAAGGKIEVLGDEVEVKSGAVVDASSAGGGGEILLGGDRQGLNPAIRNAISTTVEAGAEVRADATEAGDGGKVIVFAERDVHVHGAISARGGSQGGDGGFIETSGLRVLDITSVPDASAAAGKGGEWLIDPDDIEIVAGVGSEDPGDYTAPFTSGQHPTQLGTGLIAAALGIDQTVRITTGGAGGSAGDITLTGDIAKIAGGSAALILEAHNDIILNGDITSTSGALDITLNADAVTPDLNGQIFLNGDINALGGTVDFASGQAATITAGTFSNLTFTNSGGVVQSLTGGPGFDAVTLGMDFSLASGSSLFISNSLTLADGITVDKDNSTWRFTTTGNLPLAMSGGTGSATINNLGGIMTAGWGAASQILEIGAGVTLQGYGSLTQNTAATIVNNGAILANTAAQTFTLSPATLTNSGTLGVSDGTLTINSAAYTSSGTFQVTGGVLNLDGGFASTTLAGPFTRSGGVVNVTGTMTNTGGTVDIGGGGLFGAGGLGTLSGTINGGTLLSGDGTPLTSSSGTLDGVTIGSDLTATGTLLIANSLTLADTITLDKGNSIWRFTTTGNLPVAMVGGTGSATIDNLGGTMTAGWGATGQTLEIGSGVTLQGFGSLSQNSAATLLNNGVILANTAAQTFTLSPATLTNNGSLGVSDGTLTISSAAYTSSGSFQVTGGVLNLGGGFTTATLAGPFTRSGGQVNVTGTMTNTGNTIDIGATGLFGAGGLDLLSGSIIGGTLTSGDGTPLTASSGTLDAVTIGTDLTETGTLLIANSLTLADGITLDKGNSIWRFTTTGNLPVAMLGGTGSATINNLGGTMTAGWGATGQILEIGSGVTLQGYGSLTQSSAATVLNNGAILADTATQTFTISPATLTNNGTLGISDGTLTINSASYTSSGTFQVTGGVLNLGGGFATATLAGPFTRSGGVVNLTGTMTNTGGTLDIGAAGLFGAPGLDLLSGTIVGGTLVSNDGTALTLSNATLDGLIIGTDLAVNGTLLIRTSLTLADGITVDKGSSTWRFTTTGNLPVAMLGGTGSATIDSLGGTISSGWGVAGQTLEIGAGVTLQGYATLNQSSVATIVNNGNIIANTAAQTFTISPATFTNNGSLSVSDGTLTLSGANFTNNGPMLVSGGTLNLNNATGWSNTSTLDLTAGTVNFGGSFDVANFGSFTRSGGLVNITGSMTNSGNSLDIGGAGLFGAGGLNTLTGSIFDGTLVSNDGTPLTSSNGTLDSIIIGSNMTESGTLFIQNSLTLADGITIDKGASNWRFTTTGALPVTMVGGTGSATIDSLGGTITSGWGVSGQILEIGAGVTLQGYATLNQSTVATIVNNGNIIANTAAQTFTINPATFTNNGLLSLTDGTLTMSGANFTNTGTLQVSGGTLNLNNATDWSNGGTLGLTAGTINFGGSFDVTNFGIFNRSGGLANITGTMTNSGNTLDIGAAGLFGAGGLGTLSGSIVGGTLVSTDATPLTASNGTLDAVTFGSNLTEAGTLFIRNSLTLADGITVDKGNSSWLFTTTGNLPVALEGGAISATITSAGGTLTAGWGVAGQTLEIGAGITLQGYGNLSQSSAATIVNNGNIIANTAAQTFTINPATFTNNGALSLTDGTLTTSGANFTNTGTMQVSGGTLNLNNATDWSNGGTLGLTAGTINFGGSFDVTNFGIFNRSGGLANITGTMTNSGNTLDIGAAGLFGAGGLGTLSGSIVGGTLVSTDATPLTASNGTLDAVTFGSNLTEAGTLFIRNSLTLADGITVDKGNSSWLFTTTGNLPVALEGGAISATITSAGGTLTAGWGVAGQTLEIGAGITLQGYGNLSQSSAATIVNNGNIIANTAAQTFTINPATFTNNGALSLTDGTLTTSGANFTNTGTMQVSGGTLNLNNATDWSNGGTLGLTAGTINFGGSFDVTNFGIFNRSGGLANITGTMTNSGNTLDIGAAGLFGAGGLGTLSGSIIGGTLVSGDATPLTASNGTLDAVTLGSNLTEAGTLLVRTSLTLADGITVDKGISTWRFTTTGNLPLALEGGAVSATINNAGGTMTAGWGIAGQTLEIGAGVTLQGYGNLNQSSVAIIVNNGSIIANTAAQTFSINSATFDNLGQISATNGGTLSLFNGALVNDGLITVGAGSTVTTGNAGFTNNAGATLEGAGNFSVGSGLFTNDGSVAPGIGPNDTAILTITGDYSQGPNGLLDIELQGTTPGSGAGFHDQLLVTGTLTLNGDLTVTNVNAFVPVAFNSFRIIDGASSVTGDFLGAVTLPASFDPPTIGATFVDLLRNFVATISWDDEAGDGVWSNPLNWDDPGNVLLPGASDDVAIQLGGPVSFDATVSINSLFTDQPMTVGSGTLSIASSAQFDGLLTLSGGVVDITGAVLDLNGGMNWNGSSSIQGGGTGIVNVLGGTNINVSGAAGTRNLTALTFNLNPTASLNLSAGAALWLNTNMTFNNQGTIDFQDNVNIISSGGATINNTGTIEKTGLAGTSTISIFTNQDNGSIAQTSGSIVFSSGGSFDGATTVTGGALSLGGNYTWVDGTTFAGDLTITSGTHNIEGGLSVGTLTFDGGLINIDTLGVGSVGDTFTATNGIFMTTTTASFDTANSGILDLPNGTTLTLGGASGTRNLTALTVNVNPTATIAIGSGAALWLNTNMTLNNQGTIDFQDDVNIISSGGATINNTATIEKTGGTGASTISIFTNQNNGTIAQTSGSIVFSSGGSFDGATTVTGGALSLGGNYTWVDGTTFAGDLTITSGTHNIEGGLSVGTLTFDGGLINIDTLGVGSVGDTFTATNGIFMTTTTASFDTANSGILDLPNGTTLTLGGASGTRNLTALTVNVNPTATIAIGSGAALWLNTNMTLNNQGTIDFQDDVNIISSGGATINNTATIEKTGGTGASTISIFTNQNNGTIAQTSGSIVFSSGGSFDGATTVTGGALSLGGNYTWVDGTTFAGDLTITSGTHNIEGGLSVGTLTFDGGLINIDTLGVGSVGDTFTATNGIFMTTTTASFDTANSGILDLPNGTTLTLGGASGTRNLTALTVNVNPTATIAIGSGAALWLNTNMTLNNQGTIDFQDDVNIISSGGATINNTATIEKTGGTGASTISIFTNQNNGTIAQTSGSIVFSSGGSFDGATTVTGGALSLGGNYTWVDGTTFAGDLTITSGTHNIEGGLSVGTLTFDGGLINIDTLGVGSVGDTFTATNGIFMTTTTASFDTANSGILDLPNGTTLTLGGASGTRNLTALTVNVNPTATIAIGSGAALWLNTNMTLNNQGTIDFQDDVNIISSGGATINNSGTIVKSAGGGLSNVQILTNHSGGIVDIQTGSLSFNNNLTLGAGDVLRGSGTFVGDVTNTAGTVQPGGVGASGILTVNGDYVQGALGRLEIEIDDTGLSPGLDFDQLFVNSVGVLLLDGTLDVSLLNGAPPAGTRRILEATGATLATTFASTSIDAAFGLPDYGLTFVDLPSAGAGVVSWVGGADNFWNTAGNWSGGAVPVDTDVVFIASSFNLTVAANADANTLSLAAGSSITITAGTLTLANTSTLIGDVTINGLTAGLAVTTGDLNLNGTTVLGEGSLAVPGTITAGGLVQWNPAASLANFAITGAGTFTAGGGFDIGPGTAGETLTLDKNLVINAASIWNGDATLITGTGSIANNAAIAASNTGTAAVGVAFANNLGGTLTKTSVGSLLSFTAGLTNAGFIDVQAGTVQTTTGFTNTGTINVAIGATFDAAAVAFTNGANSLITGDGTLVAPGDGTGLLNQGEIQPGNIDVVGTLNLTGDFSNAPGGNIIIDILLLGPDPTYDRLNISGLADLDGTLTLNALAGFPGVANGDQLTPITYGSRTATTFASLVPMAGEIITPTYAASTLTLLLNLGAPTFVFDNDDGDLSWNNPLNWSSNLLPSIGDAVDLGSFQVTIAAAATANTLSLAAGGQLTITGGGLTLAGNSTLDGRLILQGGTLELGGSTLTLTNRFDWSGTSTISNGTLSMPAASRFNITGGATNSLLNVIANIAAPTAYSGGNLVLSNATFNNSGNFDLQGPRLVNGIGTAAFNSQDGGTLTKSSGGGVGGFIGTTAVTSLGNVAVQNGTLNLNGATVNLGAGDVLSSGASGTLVANVTNNGGTIRPGGAAAVGQLSIQGNYTNSSGALEVEINGPTTNDVLAVTGTTNFSAAAVTSSLNISYLSYVPAVNELHTVITCTTACSSTSSFGTLNNPIGIVHTPLYDSPAGQVRLRVDSVAFGWIGASGGAWGNGANWSLGVAPDATIDVVLPALNVSINGVATANSLIVDTGGLLTINGGGNLSLASTLRVRSGATLNNSGTLAVTGLTTVNGSYTQNTGANTTLAGLTVGGAFGHNGGAATVAGAALFTGSLGVSGGTLTMSGASAAINGPFDMTAGTVRFGTGANSIGGTNNLWQGGTLRSTTGQQTLALQAGATLQLQGAATKTLRDIRLDMSQGDVNLFGSGNLVLTNAVIDNTNGTSFHSYGNGSLTGDASSQFINNGGLFENVSGVSQIAVDFINDNASQVRVLSGSLTLLDTDLADQAAYSTNLPGTLGFAAPRTLTGSLVNAGTLAAIGPTTTLTLPTGFTNTGNVALDQATLNLNGQTLTLPAGKLLSGRGTIQNGQVVNNGGVVLVGGPGQLGNLTLDGDYTQNAGSTMVVEVFNNGKTNQTITDTFTVTSAGNTTLNGGALVIGFASNSAGLVLADVSPLQLANAPTGQFGQVIDAGGNILGFKFSGGVLTILGVTPKTPDALIDDLVGFIQNKEEIREIIESNESLAQIIGDEIARRREQEEQQQEDSSLICTAGA